jgi:hypothetical protein
MTPFSYVVLFFGIVAIVYFGRQIVACYRSPEFKADVAELGDRRRRIARGEPVE